MSFLPPCFSRGALRRHFLAAGALATVASLALTGTAHAGLVIVPSAIENSYVGPIDLTIDGLDSPGQTVVLEEFFDSDASRTITSGDLLVRKINVTDGTVTSIAGERNLNIPGDEDGVANQQIHTRLVYLPGEIVGRVSGRYIYRVSPAGGSGFTPSTASLAVSQHDFGGSGISGQVVGGRPLVGQPGSFVLFLTGSGSDNQVVGIARSDASGNYTLKLPPGTYQPVGSRAGFVFDTWSGPLVAVASGAFATNHAVTLTPSQRTIAGAVRDAVSLAGLPAVPLWCSSTESGFVAVTFTDGNGNFSADSSAEPCAIGAEESQVAQLGCLFIEGQNIEPSAGSVTGFNIDLPRVTSLIYGSVETPAGTPVPFVDISSQSNGLPDYRSSAFSDANGNYTLGVTLGDWNLYPEATAGFLFQRPTVVVNNNATAVPQDITAHPITAYLRGQVRDNHNNPVANLDILAAAESYQSEGIGINSSNISDANGNFELGVFGSGTSTEPWVIQIFFHDVDGPHQYVSSRPSFAVQDGVDQNGIVFLVYTVTTHLRGQVLDENDTPLGNFNMWANSNTPAVGTSSHVDSGGSFDLALLGGSWKLGLGNISGLGLIPQELSVTVVDHVDQNGLIFRAIHGDATISGTLKSATNVPIGGVNVSGVATNGGNTYSSTGVSDANGNYSFPVFSGLWTVSVDTSGLNAQGYQPVASQQAFVPSGTVTVNFVATQALPADLNGDGVVDGGDLGALLGSWGPAAPGTPADLNHDGMVDGNDLGALLGSWTI